MRIMKMEISITFFYIFYANVINRIRCKTPSSKSRCQQSHSSFALSHRGIEGGKRVPRKIYPVDMVVHTGSSKQEYILSRHLLFSAKHYYIKMIECLLLSLLFSKLCSDDPASTIHFCYHK